MFSVQNVESSNVFVTKLVRDTAVIESQFSVTTNPGVIRQWGGLLPSLAAPQELILRGPYNWLPLLYASHACMLTFFTSIMSPPQSFAMLLLFF